MLEQARKRSDIEWVLGDLASVAWDREFDLIVMTGHAFQVFIDDREIQASLAAIRSALTDDGRFVFETRNPRFQAWKTWTTETCGPDRGRDRRGGSDVAPGGSAGRR